MMTSENAIWVLRMMRERDSDLDVERDAIDFAIQAIRERDAAIERLSEIHDCVSCAHDAYNLKEDCCYLDECNWEWRGVQNENS